MCVHGTCSQHFSLESVLCLIRGSESSRRTCANKTAYVNTHICIHTHLRTGLLQDETQVADFRVLRGDLVQHRAPPSLSVCVARARAFACNLHHKIHTQVDLTFRRHALPAKKGGSEAGEVRAAVSHRASLLSIHLSVAYYRHTHTNTHAIGSLFGEWATDQLYMWLWHAQSEPL